MYPARWSKAGLKVDKQKETCYILYMEKEVKKYYIGDLVMHISTNRIGVVTTDSTVLLGYPRGVHVCYVAWSDTHYSNLMDIGALSGVFKSK